MLSDLDILFPENDQVTFKDKKTKKEYVVDIFISTELGEFIIENISLLQEVFPSGGSKRPKITKELYRLCLKLIGKMIEAQHPELTVAWIKTNLSIPKLIFIMYKMLKPVYEFINQSGFLEMVTPQKKPEEQEKPKE